VCLLSVFLLQHQLSRADSLEQTNHEMKKAMKQVFGDIDERKVAAQQIQKPRQHRSVREFITEFQTISSGLEWHEEALADKFLEGLKPAIHYVSRLSELPWIGSTNQKA
jgi:Retrotransposon gag protein